MQLQMTTDYSMRIVAYMLTNDAMEKDKLVKAKEMAEILGIDYQYSMKVINKLKGAGIIKSVQGCSGGYYLSNSVFGLTFYDIISLMEGEIYLLKCLEGEKCTREKKMTCPVQSEFNKLQETFVSKLKEIKISDVCNDGF